MLSLFFSCQIHASEKPASPVGPKLLPETEIMYAEVYPLHAAAAQNNIGAIYDLVQNDAIPTELSDQFGYTPLHYAAAAGHIEATNILLSLDAEVHVKANYGETPIKLARQNGHSKLAEFLIIYEKARLFKIIYSRFSPITVPSKK